MDVRSDDKLCAAPTTKAPRSQATTLPQRESLCARTQGRPLAAKRDSGRRTKDNLPERHLRAGAVSKQALPNDISALAPPVAKDARLGATTSTRPGRKVRAELSGGITFDMSGRLKRSLRLSARWRGWAPAFLD